MLEGDPTICRQLAQKMNSYNEDRKVIEAQLTEHALEQAGQRFSDKPRSWCAAWVKRGIPEWLGLLPENVQLLGKPCIVLAQSTTEPAKDRGVASKALILWTHCQDARNF